MAASATQEESDRKTARSMYSVHRVFLFLAYLATLIYVFSIPLEKAVAVEGIGSISRAIGIPLVVLWVLALVFNPMYLRIHRFFVAATMFVIWIGLTRFWADDPDASDFFLATYVQLLLSSFCIWFALTSEVKCRRAMQVLVLGAWGVVVVVWYNFQTGNLEGERATIASADQNEIALVLAMCMTVAVYLVTEKHSSGRKSLVAMVAFSAFVPAAMLSIIMTGSRGGTLAAVPALLLLLFSLRKAGTGAKILIIAVVLAGAGYIAVNLPEAQFERIATTQEELETGEIGGRGRLWVMAYDLWSRDTETMLGGIGAGSFITNTSQVVHNTHLSVLTETGIAGFVIYLTMLLFLVGVIRRSGDSQVKAFLFLLLISWLIGSTALTWEYRKPTWVVWTLILCVGVVKRGQYMQLKQGARRKRRAHGKRSQLA